MRPLRAFTNTQITAMLTSAKEQVLANGFNSVATWSDGTHSETMENGTTTGEFLEMVTLEAELRGLIVPDGLQYHTTAKCVGAPRF